MRGDDRNQSALFSYLSPEERVPVDHPLRSIRRMSDAVLGGMSERFADIYSPLGRRSVAPEKLLRALLLQILYSVRSERLLMEQLHYNLLFRWFVGLNLDEAIWDATVYSKNRERLLDGDIARLFFAGVVEQARAEGLLSDEHFTVDGTLLEAWASMKSYQSQPEPPQHGSGSRGNWLRRDLYQSTTDAEAYLYRKSKKDPYQLSYLGHVLMENRSGLPVAGVVTTARPEGEWEAALEMLSALPGGGNRITLAADKAYDEARFVAALRERRVTPPIQQYQGRTSNLDGRTTRHPGYAISVQKRKRIEHIFGWLKTTALMRKVRHRGRALVEWMFTLALSAYNLVRLSRLTVASA